MADETNALDFKSPIFSLSGKGKSIAELISILALCVTGVLAYAFWMHNEASASGDKDLQVLLEKNQNRQDANFRDLSENLKAQTREAKFQTCILSLKQEEREKQFNSPNSLCARMSR